MCGRSWPRAGPRCAADCPTWWWRRSYSQARRIRPGVTGLCRCAKLDIRAAGWSSSVARWAHNPEVAGSNPVPATESRRSAQRSGAAEGCAGSLFSGDGRVLRIAVGARLRGDRVRHSAMNRVIVARFLVVVAVRDGAHRREVRAEVTEERDARLLGEHENARASVARCGCRSTCPAATSRSSSLLVEAVEMRRCRAMS